MNRKKELHRGASRLTSAVFPNSPTKYLAMPREHVTIECTEARAEGKPVSRYMTTRDKRKQPERVEKMKYNKHLRRHTLHREIKN